MSAVQTRTVCCCQKQGGLLECTTSVTRETKWVEGSKEEGQLLVLGRVVSQFKEAGWLTAGGGEVCWASCKLALEGVVSEAFELWNKDPIVMPLTLGLGGRVEAFPLKLLGQ